MINIQHLIPYGQEAMYDHRIVLGKVKKLVSCLTGRHLSYWFALQTCTKAVGHEFIQGSATGIFLDTFCVEFHSLMLQIVAKVVGSTVWIIGDIGERPAVRLDFTFNSCVDILFEKSEVQNARFHTS